MKQIVDIQIMGLRQRLADLHVELDLADEARSHLAHVGYDPVYGARSLKRAIQKEMETPLARLMLEGKIKDGETVTAVLDAATGNLDFSITRPETKAKSRHTG